MYKEIEAGYNVYRSIIDHASDRRMVAKTFLSIVYVQTNGEYKRSPKSFPLAALVLAAEDVLSLQ